MNFIEKHCYRWFANTQTRSLGWQYQQQIGKRAGVNSSAAELRGEALSESVASAKLFGVTYIWCCQR